MIEVYLMLTTLGLSLTFALVVFFFNLKVKRVIDQKD